MSNKALKSPKTRPISVRLTGEERLLLEQQARGRPLSEYIRNHLFPSGSTKSSEVRLSKMDRTRLLAQILAKLGTSKSGKALVDLSELVSAGVFPASEDIAATLRDAQIEFRSLRQDLLKALGSRPKNGGHS